MDGDVVLREATRRGDDCDGVVALQRIAAELCNALADSYSELVGFFRSARLVMLEGATRLKRRSGGGVLEGR